MTFMAVIWQRSISIKKATENFYMYPVPCIYPPSLDRLEGFRKYLGEQGLEKEAVEVHETQPTWVDSYHMMMTLLEDKLAATAIFAFNDFMAIGILKRAAHASLFSPPGCGAHRL